MLNIRSNAEIQRLEDEELEKDAEERQSEEVIQGLAGYVRLCWQAAKEAKQPIEDKMLESLQQRNNKYSGDKLEAIKRHGGSEVFIGLTEVKCRAAESWLRDILLETGSPLWDMKATPIPEVSPEQEDNIKILVAEELVRLTGVNGSPPSEADRKKVEEIIKQKEMSVRLQEADNAAKRMKTKIEDQFAEGGWAEAFNDFITDLVTFPCAFVKGPVIRRKRKLAYKADENGEVKIHPEEVLAPEYERVDPFRIYPEPGVTNINDGYIFQHHPLTRMELSDLIGVPSYDEEAIRKLLEYGNSQSWVDSSIKYQKEQEERKFYADRRPTDIYDALEFWGRVSGKMLIEWGMPKDEISDEAREYDVNLWLVGNYVIKAVLNYDPLGDKPYTKTSFIKTPGSFWGKGIPDIIEDLQDICNATARALINNIGIASGPQVDMNVERLVPDEDITQMFPWKVWQTLNDPNGANTPAIRFMQPSDNSISLVNVYDKFSKLADDNSGIPAYVYGDLDVKGAGRTASGLSMLMGSAGKGIRQVVMHIDADIVKLVVKKQFIYNMRYDKDNSIKGDVNITPKGTVNLAVKETVNMRRIEFLNATNNETDLKIMGLEGRAAILSEIAKGLQMPVDSVIPSREGRYFAEKTQSQGQIQNQQEGEVPTTDNAEVASRQVDGSPKGGIEANMVSNRGVNG